MKNKEQLIYEAAWYLKTYGELPVWWSKYHVGGEVRIPHGSPGIGYTKYRITKINSDGIWGVVTRSYHRELSLADVR